MSKKEEKKEQEVKVFKGRPRPRTERRKGAKKIDLTASAKLFDVEFYFYWPDPEFDTKKYRNDDGTVDIDQIPAEQLIEFKCRYIDPGTLQKLAKTPFAWDSSDTENKSPEELQQLILEALKNQQENFKSEEEFRSDVVFACVLDPQFESVEQVRKLLPLALVTELYLEITRGAIGDNLVARFQESN